MPDNIVEILIKALGIDETSEAFESLKGAAESSFEGIKDAALGAAEGIGAFTGMAETLKESVEIFAEIQKADIALTHLTGSAQAATEVIEQMEQLAKSDAIAFPELLPAAQRMVAVGIALDEIKPAMDAAANASWALGTSVESVSSKMEGMALSGMAGGRQLRTLGLSSEDLASVMGVSLDMVQKSFKNLDVDQRLEVLILAMQKFAGTAKAESEGIAGTWVEVKTAWHEAFGRIGADIAPVIEWSEKVAAGMGDMAHAMADAAYWKHMLNSAMMVDDGYYGKKSAADGAIPEGETGPQGQDKIQAAVKEKQSADIQAATAAEIIQNKIAANAAQVKLDTSKVEDSLKVEKLGAEAEIESLKNVHQRAETMAAEDIRIAQEKADRLGAIDKKALADTLALLAEKRGAITAGKTGKDRDPAAEAAEGVRIDAEAAAAQAAYLQKTQALQAAVDAARANAIKVDVTNTREADAQKLKSDIEIADKMEAISAEMTAAQDAAIKKHAEAVMAIDKEIEEGAAHHAQALAKIADDAAQTMLDRGEITKTQYLKIKQEQYDKEYAALMLLLKREREALADSNLSPDEKAKRGAALDNQQQAGTDTHAAQTGATQAAQAKLQMQQVGQFVDPIVDAWSKGIEGMLNGTEKLGTAFKKMAKGMLDGEIDALVKIAAKHAETALANEAIHILTDHGILVSTTSSEAEAAAAAKALRVANTLDTITSDAGMAAAGQFAYYSLSDPTYAPEAAALAFGEVMAFNAVSASGGADLPNYNTLGFLHPKEMVLPQSQADVIRGLAAGRGGNSSSSTMRDFNYHAAKNEPLSARKLKSMIGGLQRNSNQ